MTIPWQDYIEQRPDVMLGELVFKGTRLAIEHILREFGTGMSPAELFNNYPNLNPEHLQATMKYAVDRMAIERPDLV